MEVDMAGDGKTSRRWREKIRPQFRAQCAKEHAACWLCTHSIDYAITDPNDDEVWEPDHLYPRSTHPELAEDPGNLRASHRACNRVRSNKQHTELHTLGTPKKNWFS